MLIGKDDRDVWSRGPGGPVCPGFRMPHELSLLESQPNNAAFALLEVADLSLAWAYRQELKAFEFGSQRSQVQRHVCRTWDGS